MLIKLSQLSKEVQASIKEELAAPKPREEIVNFLQTAESLALKFANDLAKPLKSLSRFLKEEGVTNSEKVYIATSIQQIEVALKAINKQVDKVADTRFYTHRIDLPKK